VRSLGGGHARLGGVAPAISAWIDHEQRQGAPSFFHRHQPDQRGFRQVGVQGAPLRVDAGVPRWPPSTAAITRAQVDGRRAADGRLVSAPQYVLTHAAIFRRQRPRRWAVVECSPGARPVGGGRQNLGIAGDHASFNVQGALGPRWRFRKVDWQTLTTNAS
jgi:hypothetical protein